MIREKYNLMRELYAANANITGKKKMSLAGQGDFPGANNVKRGEMNTKHHSQHLTIDDPEFPFMFDGKENVIGEFSSFHMKTDKKYEVIDVVKKYNERLKGRSRFALYFLHCKDDNSYIVVERKELENLTENFGFQYVTDYLDQSSVGDIIPEGTTLYKSTSYDEYDNFGFGVNGRCIHAVHPAVQDDAIVISESFAKKMVTNKVVSRVIPVNDNTIFLNLYGEQGKNGRYQGLPNIGDYIDNGIICATRTIRENRMFSDMRDAALNVINDQTDQVYYGTGEIIDINVYNNNPKVKLHKVNAQLIEYYNDLRWFYTKVYKICKMIINSGSTDIDDEIHRWMRLAMNHLDTQSVWAWNDNVFPNMMVEILIREKEPLTIARKITGRAGNKTVVCGIWPDDEMPYLATDIVKDEYGIEHPVGIVERVDMITNPLAPINRTIPMIPKEGSVTFIMDRARKHAATMSNYLEQKEFMFDIINCLNSKLYREMEDLWETLSERERKEYVSDMISLNRDGTINTNNGMYLRAEAFDEEFNLRDGIVKVYEKYGDIIKPYHIFMPKPKWGRDIYIGEDCIGYQYMLMLKQSGDKGFSVRSAGSISDESLPEKDHQSKIGRSRRSNKPIRFGEYETPNFMIVTDPNDFALISALYRASVDGRRYMYEAIISDDGKYNIPDSFTSRTSEILQVYLKSLGVSMKTVINEDDYIGEKEHSEEVVGYEVGGNTIFCTIDEMYYLKKIHKVYKKYMRKNPNTIDDVDEVWDYIMEHLPFKKKLLTDNIINMFKDNLEAFSVG